jgi:toxin ParE1/3/4
MTGFVFHPDAILDLEEIWDFIAADSVAAADHFLDELREAILLLVPHPHIGHLRPDLTDRPVRFLPVRDLLIAYAPDEAPLVVLGILHGRRNPRVIAALLRERE